MTPPPQLPCHSSSVRETQDDHRPENKDIEDRILSKIFIYYYYYYYY